MPASNKTHLTRKLKAGDVLFNEGELSLSMFLVDEGKLSVYKTVQEKEVELAHIGQGEIVGEMSFFDASPRSASVRAMTDVNLIELPYVLLQEQFDNSPDWLKIIIKSIIANLKSANQKINELQNK